MPKRTYARKGMAHPRTSSQARTPSQARPPSASGKAKTSSSSGGGSRQAAGAGGGSGRFGRWLWAWLTGPAGQQVLSLVLIAIGVVTLITLIPGANPLAGAADPGASPTPGSTSGALVGGWVRLLVFVFGWAAYPVAVLIALTGLLWLRHLVHQATAWRWRPFLGLELVLLGLQTLTYTLINQHSWGLVESGKGGGVIGWALYLFLSDYLGPLITGLLMGLVVIVGIALAFDLTRRDLALFGNRISEVWSAYQAARTARLRARELSPSRPLSPPQARRIGGNAPGNSLTAPPSGHPAIQRASVSTSPRGGDAKNTAAKPRRSLSLVPHPLSPVPLTILQESRTAGMDPQEIERKSRIIEETLEQFGVPARVTEVRPGPTVTQFGVSPGYISRGSSSGDSDSATPSASEGKNPLPWGRGGEGRRKVRVSQIASLSDDLALALAARSLRVEAPVPGRAVVGIEVPNAETSLVRLRSVLESEAFRKCGRPLCFAVGLDVAGGPQVADLSRMPHLLVAGTTGSGKSIFIKAVAASLVMHNTPDDLRLIAIDPKIVELSHLNGLPHLLGSAETDIERGLRVLRWVAHEMDERYKLFARSVARNLEDYNARLARRRTSQSSPKGGGSFPSAVEDEGKPLPRIVVFIDELADMMMSAPEETERTLTRIAQMARATGIHLVVATQRPSTDVVTGLIKANFPARVSFATASGVDSRVIIDSPGAESLLGSGDMLFLPPDASAPIRVQGCYISDNELEAIIQFWQQEAGATPAKAPWDVLAEARGPDNWRIEGLDEDADLLEQAISYAKNRGKVSTSGIQRRLRISYPRAARLMEQMETMGLVGPQESAGRKRAVILGGDDDIDI